MKLQFKEQDFQLQSVDAVVKCFEGQPIKTNRFTLERSRDIIRKTPEHFEAKTVFTKDQNVLRTNEILKKTYLRFFNNWFNGRKRICKKYGRSCVSGCLCQIAKEFLRFHAHCQLQFRLGHRIG